MKKINVVVWNEYVHESRDARIAKLYPQGIHGAIAQSLRKNEDFAVKTATLPEPDHGLTEELLRETDVLLWWGHCAHDKVDDAIVDRVKHRVLQGMGLIVLHSGHYSKIFRRLMGTTCSLTWREAGEKERLWVCNPGHPIAQGIDKYFEIEHVEMYGEPFAIPEPQEQVFISWFEGGEVFRSGNCWHRGNGKIFYFRPGHETFPIYQNKTVQMILDNAVRWAKPQGTWIDSCPNITTDLAPEKIGE